MIHVVRPVLDVDNCSDSLSVTVMVNPLCTETEYPVLVTFGARVIGSDMCEEQQNATLMLLSSGQSATFSVCKDTVTLRDNEEYCYIVSINGKPGEHTTCTVPYEYVHKDMSVDRLHAEESLACNLHQFLQLCLYRDDATFWTFENFSIHIVHKNYKAEKYREKSYEC